MIHGKATESHMFGTSSLGVLKSFLSNNRHDNNDNLTNILKSQIVLELPWINGDDNDLLLHRMTKQMHSPRRPCNKGKKGE